MERRKSQRYRLHLPLRIVRIGEKRTSRAGKTRDIGSGGVCFSSQGSIETGERVEYVITLSQSSPAVFLRCGGKVLRRRPELDPIQDTGEYVVTMDRYQFVRAGTPEAELASF